MISRVNIAALIPFLILIGVICLVVGFWHELCRSLNNNKWYWYCAFLNYVDN